MRKQMLILAVLFLATACSEGGDPATDHIDAGRVTVQARSLAQIWLEYAPTDNGYFQVHYDRTWRPLRRNASFVSTDLQSRLLYVFARGYDLSGNVKYLEAIRSGGGFMLSRLRNPKNHGWYLRVGPKGKVIRGDIYPYVYSFAIFGLAHAYRVTGDHEFLDAAMATWRANVWPGLHAARRYAGRSASGESGSQPVMGSRLIRTNSLMHLFEALLVLHDMTGDPEIWSDIDALAGLFSDRLVQANGALPEYFEPDTLAPQAESKGGIVEIGHTVEMAFLLGHAVDKGLDERYLAAAGKLLDFVLEYGIDPGTGSLFSISDYRGRATDETRVFWGQTELMRTAIHFAQRSGRADLWRVYENARSYWRRHFLDGEFGGVNTSSQIVSSQGGGNSKQAGYHTMTYYEEALRASAASPNP